MEYSSDGGTTWTVWDHRGTRTSTTITGLTNDTTYQVRVASVNDTGTSTGYAGPLSQTPVAAPRVPGAPAGLAVTAGDGELTAAWTAPAYLGNPPSLDGCLVEYRASGSWRTDNVSVSGTAATISGLTNDRTYQVRRPNG